MLGAISCPSASVLTSPRRTPQCKDSSDELALVYTPVASTSLANSLLPAGKAEVTLQPSERINIALCVVRGLHALHEARQVGHQARSAGPISASPLRVDLAYVWMMMPRRFIWT